MRKIFLTFTILIVSSVLFSSCDAPAANNAANKPANNANTAPVNTANVEADIKKLANDGIAATLKGDTAAMEKLWADNYTFIGQDGSVSTRAERLESIKAGSTKIESLAYDDINVRVNAEGTGALLVARGTVKGTSMGKPVDGQVRISQVWSKTKDGWRQVSTHVTNITGAAAAPPAANANKPAANKAVANTKATSPAAASDATDSAPPAPKR